MKEVKTRIKVIRCTSQFVEEEVQMFIDSLNQNPAQIISIDIHGIPTNNHLIAVTILYQA